MPTAPYHAGLTTLHQELADIELPLQGRLPEWLNGQLIRTGPAQFEVGEQSYRHWFDGLAMLYKFAIADQKITYSNRFLQSGSYRDAQQNHTISRSEFATNPARSLLQRVLPFSPNPPITDNANVNVSAIANQMVALTETPTPVIFDPNTLETLGELHYTDALSGLATTAHPHFDADHDQIISYHIQFGQRCTYELYTLSGKSTQRRRLAQISVDQPAYMHSFAITERYIVLVECPFVVNPLQLATMSLHNTPFIENYRWQPSRGTRFHIIDRNDGHLVNACTGDPFFVFHYVNAFEQDGQIVLDASSYADPSIIQDFYLDRLRQGIYPLTVSHLTRYYLPLQGQRVKTEILSDASFELPRINYRRCNGKAYQVVYGGDNQRSHPFIDRLVKLNLTTGQLKGWQQPNCYPGEPVFVAAPHASAEDEGVLLSVVLDAASGQSFLLVLDAQSFEAIAQANLPHSIPFNFHGQFFGHADE